MQKTQSLDAVMQSPQPPPALQIYVNANPEAWFSRLRARCDDLGQAMKSVRPREILLVTLLQRQGGKPDGHYQIPGKIHPPLSRVLATAAWWCPPDGNSLALATDVKAEFRQRYQEVVEKARMRPGKVAFKKELAKMEKETENAVVIERLLESLNRYLSRGRQHQPDHQVLRTDPIKAYLSAIVHLFWATANLFQLAPWDGLLMAELNDVSRQRAGRILRAYITAVMCAEKGSQIVNAHEGEVDDHIKAGREQLAFT